MTTRTEEDVYSMPVIIILSSSHTHLFTVALRNCNFFLPAGSLEPDTIIVGRQMIKYQKDSY